MPANDNTAMIMAGIPAVNANLFRRIRFSVCDPVVLIEFPGESGSLLLTRDIEMARARKQALVDSVGCPADYAPDGGLSGDRETATAQATAECLRRAGIKHAIGDRTLPLIYSDILRRAGIEVSCDPGLGVIERRQKDEDEISWLRESQRMTERAIEMACRMIGRARAAADGSLEEGGAPLTSERVRLAIDHFFLDHGYTNPPSIIACGPAAADCHNIGSGVIRTGQPVIVDIFPQNKASRYCGDCTRTVVHGEIPDEVARMHQAVARAKEAAIAVTRAGVTGEQVHLATTEAIRSSGYEMGLPKDGAPDTYCAMTHGTGHGIGLDVHEPPLLDLRGPELLVGDALTIEPGLYCQAVGAVRLEDMVIVTEEGCDNLNQLPGELTWI